MSFFQHFHFWAFTFLPVRLITHRQISSSYICYTINNGNSCAPVTVTRSSETGAVPVRSRRHAGISPSHHLSSCHASAHQPTSFLSDLSLLHVIQQVLPPFTVDLPAKPRWSFLEPSYRVALAAERIILHG
jgi:hypothetical protein